MREAEGMRQDDVGLRACPSMKKCDNIYNTTQYSRMISILAPNGEVVSLGAMYLIRQVREPLSW